MKYRLPSPREHFSGVLAGYHFIDGICEVPQKSGILEKYYLAYEDGTKEPTPDVLEVISPVKYDKAEDPSLSIATVKQPVIEKEPVPAPEVLGSAGKRRGRHSKSL